MCGIAGLCCLAPNAPEDLALLAGRMGAAIAHRGPDAAGTWQHPALGVALAHQRLAILDLSPAGHQPMASASGRYVIAFNGEIYNHQQLRRNLDAAGMAPTWRGHGDTETLLAAIEAWGLESALQRCAGMWALALVDQQERVLHLARDRFGEKPLYWGVSGSGRSQALLFGSELAALRAYPRFNNAIDRAALAELLRFGQVPAPLSIYAGIAKLPAGHWVSIPLPLAPGASLPRSQPWWQLSSVIEAGGTAAFQSDAEALDALEQSLNLAVAEQAIADVPLGAFLSGGIDSSLIAVLLQRSSNKPLRTFTIGFEEAGFNEAPFARAVAEYLGTSHSETLLTSADARALIPQLPQLYSEPFADSSQLPTYLVCRAARQAGLTVALSGDGGDELFGGYNRYFWGPRIWNRLAWLPGLLRRGMGRAITALPPSAWDALGQQLPVRQIGHKAHKLAARLRHVSSSDDLYRSLVSEWRDPAALLQGDLPNLPSTAIDQPLPECLSSDPIARMMAWDSLSYLPDDILVKVDRAAMAVGLETRAPFLDHRVAQVAWRLPMAMKIRGNTSKWALRQILYQHVPRELIERPMAGRATRVAAQLCRRSAGAWDDAALGLPAARADSDPLTPALRLRPVSHRQALAGVDMACRVWIIN